MPSTDKSPTSASKPVVAVVVTYNRKDLLCECLEALKKQTAADQMDILVVDNASIDGTETAVRPFVDAGQIRYINTGANLGGAGGFNFGMREAVAAGYEFLWLMDDDCIPREDALEELLAVAQALDERWGFLASRVEWIDGSLCKMNEVKLAKPPHQEHGCERCRQASFVSLFVSASVMREAGLPITDFFIWGDDVEYTRRISSICPSYYVPKSIVVHKTKNNAGSDISRDDSGRLERYRYAYRNEVYIARQEGLSRKAYQAAKIILHLGRVLAFAPNEKGKRAGIILSSSMEGFSFNPSVEYPMDQGEFG